MERKPYATCFDRLRNRSSAIRSKALSNFRKGFILIMIQRNLQDACKSLHLSYIIDHYDEISFETKEQFLRDIFNIELESRQKKVANLIKKAKFRELKWLKNYEWSEQIHLPSTTSQEHICELRFLKANKIFYYLDLLEQGKHI